MISFSEETRFKYCVLAKDALKAALVSANRGAIECSSKWKSDMEFARTSAWYLCIPEKRKREASTARPKCARNFPPPLPPPILLLSVCCCCCSRCVCSPRRSFPRRVPRARRSNEDAKMHRCFPIAIASHRAMDFSARNADDFVLPIVVRRKRQKRRKMKSFFNDRSCSPLRFLGFSSSFLSSSSLCVVCVKSNASMKMTTMV